MNVLSRFKNALKAFRMQAGVSDFANPLIWSPVSSEAIATAAGTTISGETSLGLSAYYACIRNISEDVAKLPLQVFDRIDDEVRERRSGHPVERLLRFPNPWMSGLVFRETLTHWALGWGNGYAVIERGPMGDPVSLTPAHPNLVTVEFDDDGQLMYTIRLPMGRLRTYEADRIIHIRGLGSELIGYSVFRHAAQSLGLTKALEEFGANYFGNGVTLKGAITIPAGAGPKQRENIERSLDRLAGVGESWRHMVLEEGMTWERMGVPPEEGQFIETRGFQVTEIARWFRMPPHKIQHLDKATFSNIEHQGIEYYEDTLSPWLIRWEDQISEKLLDARAVDATLFPNHQRKALMQMDSKARGEFHTKMFMVGIMSQNDIRAAEDLNPIGPQGDTYYVPLNMRDSAKEEAGDPVSPSGLGSGDDSAAVLEPAPDDDGEGEMGQRDRLVLARVLRPILMDAVGRMVRKEHMAVTRARKKYAGDHFAEWKRNFIDDHERVVRDAFRATAEVVGGFLGSDAREGVGLVGAFTATHLAWEDESASATRIDAEVMTLMRQAEAYTDTGVKTT